GAVNVGAGTLTTDNGPGGPTNNVLTYTLPFLGVQGDAISDISDIDDVLRFDGAGHLFFYSDQEDGIDSLADNAPIPGTSYGNQVFLPNDDDNGTEMLGALYYKPAPGQPGYDAASQPAYVFYSNGDVVVGVPTVVNQVFFDTESNDPNFNDNYTTFT